MHSTADETVAPPKNTRQRSAQACQACRISRRKCEGGHPCFACVRKGVPCVYLPKEIQKRRGPRGKKDKLNHIQRENQELRVQLQRLTHSAGLVSPGQVAQTPFPAVSGLPQIPPIHGDAFPITPLPASQFIANSIQTITTGLEAVAGQVDLKQIQQNDVSAVPIVPPTAVMEHMAHHTNKGIQVSPQASDTAPVYGFDRMKTDDILSQVEQGYLRAYFAMVNPLFPAVDDNTFWDTLTAVRAQQQAVRAAKGSSAQDASQGNAENPAVLPQGNGTTVCEKCYKTFCPCPTLPPQSVNDVTDLEGFLILLELLCATGAKILGQASIAKEYFRTATTLMKKSQSKYYRHEYPSETEMNKDAVIASEDFKLPSTAIAQGFGTLASPFSPSAGASVPVNKDEKPGNLNVNADANAKRSVLVYTGPTSIHRISYHLLICIFGQAMGHRIEDAEKNSRDAIILYNRLTVPLPVKLQSTFLLLSASMRQLVTGHLSLQIPEESAEKNGATRFGFIIGTCLYELQENFPSLDFGEDASANAKDAGIAKTHEHGSSSSLPYASGTAPATESVASSVSTSVSSLATTSDSELPSNPYHWTSMSFLDMSPSFGTRDNTFSLEAASHMPSSLSNLGLFGTNNNTNNTSSEDPAVSVGSLPSLFPGGVPAPATNTAPTTTIATTAQLRGSPSRPSSRGGTKGGTKRKIPFREFIHLLDEALRLHEENPNLMPSFPLQAAIAGLKALVYARASARKQTEMINAIRACLTLSERHPLARTCLGLSLVIARLIPILKAVIDTESSKTDSGSSNANTLNDTDIDTAPSSAVVETLQNLLLRASHFVQSSPYGHAALVIALKAGPGGLRARYRAKRRLSTESLTDSNANANAVQEHVHTGPSVAYSHAQAQTQTQTQVQIPGQFPTHGSAPATAQSLSTIHADCPVTQMAQSLSDTKISIDMSVAGGVVGAASGAGGVLATNAPMETPSQPPLQTNVSSSALGSTGLHVPLNQPTALPALLGPPLLPVPDTVSVTATSTNTSAAATGIAAAGIAASPQRPALRLHLNNRSDAPGTALSEDYGHPGGETNLSLLTPTALANPVVHDDDFTPIGGGLGSSLVGLPPDTHDSHAHAHVHANPVPPLGYPGVGMAPTPQKAHSLDSPGGGARSPTSVRPSTTPLHALDGPEPGLDVNFFDFDLQFKLPPSFPVPEVGGRPEVDEFSLIPLSLFRTNSTSSV